MEKAGADESGRVWSSEFWLYLTMLVLLQFFDPLFFEFDQQAVYESISSFSVVSPLRFIVPIPALLGDQEKRVCIWHLSCSLEERFRPRLTSPISAALWKTWGSGLGTVSSRRTATTGKRKPLRSSRRSPFYGGRQAAGQPESNSQRDVRCRA
ncbi:hypothetical protein VTK56DRAFT_377 [Thermocarpiscus australiensis]